MGLLTEEVEVVLNPRNIKYYEDLGYEIPRRKDKWGQITTPKGMILLIKSKDLKDGSNVKVNVQCDNCKKIIKNVKWQNYNKYKKEDGKYYCQQCATILFARKKMQITKLKNGKSFEYWCLENNRQDILDRWDYELNDYKPNQVLFKSHQKYYFKCPKEIHKSELKSISDFTTGHDGVMNCDACNSIAQWGISNFGEDFLEKYLDKDKNDKLKINPWGISWNSLKSIYIKCQNTNYHGSYKTSCLLFTKGNKCPYCSGYSGKVHILDSLGILYPEVLKIWSENKKSPYEYTHHSNKKVWWKCSEGKHQDYKRSIDASNRADFRCPECVRERDESLLQEKVRLYLNTLGYTILHERNCTLIARNPKYKGSRAEMLYDNEVKELKLIIEVHGQQHYNIGNFHKMSAKYNNTTPEYELHMQQVRDRYKRIYAKSQGYNYLEISYWKFNNKETWKKLIEDKINKIKCI